MSQYLRQNLNALDGTAVIIANVIGVGIFTVPGFVYGSVQQPKLFLMLWVVGGILAIIGGNAYSRLAIKFPNAGGEYLYLSKSMFPLMGFLSGWTSYIAGFSGAIAASAVGLSAYLGRMISLNEASQTAISIVVVIVITLLHVTGVKRGNKLNHLLNGLLLTTFLVLCIRGLTTTPLTLTDIELKPSSTSDLFSALIPILFTYSGWNAAVYMAEEFKNPEKSISKAVFWGTLTVTSLYILINYLYIKFVPVNELSQTIEVGHLLGAKLFGEVGSIVINMIIITALLSSISAMTMAGPRIYFAMARDGLLFGQMSRINKNYETPSIAIIAQCLWTILLILTGSFEDILLYTGFSIILFSALTVASTMLLKNQLKPIPIYWIIMYALFILVSVLVLASSFITRTSISLTGTFLISLGIPLFYWLRKRQKQDTSS